MCDELNNNASIGRKDNNIINLRGFVPIKSAFSRTIDSDNEV